MELEDYLQAIENCPDERVDFEGSSHWKLTTDFGIFDNWPILLKSDFESALDSIVELGYTLIQKRQNRDEIACELHRDKGAVELWLKNYEIPKYTTTHFTNYPESLEHQKRQLANFNVGLMLHPYLEDSNFGENPENNTNWCREIANAITEIGKLAIAKQIPLCFPESIGWKNLYDYSQTIYFPEMPQITQTL